MGNAAAFAALARVKRVVNELGKVPSQMARPSSEAILGLLRAQFAAQTDAYGRPWAPHSKETVRRWGEHPIGRLTGKMYNGLEVKPMAGSGISIIMGADYSAFFQLKRP